MEMQERSRKETSKYSNDCITFATDIGMARAKLDLDLNCKVKLMRWLNWEMNVEVLKFGNWVGS